MRSTYRLARSLFLLFGGLLAVAALGGAAVLAELPAGVVAMRPAEGRYVKVEQGYMVPYSQTIPGTDVSFQMVPIPGGRFLMGSPETEEGRNPDEGPQVEIELPPFWIGKYEVTWSEYRIFIDLCGIFEKFEDLEIRQVTEDNQVDAISAPSKLYDSSFTFSSGEDPRQPAVSMSQYAAKQYTKWLSLLTQQFFRLPSEAEWEYACRAGSTTAYCFGDSEDQLGDYAWFYENSDDKTQPVGLKKPNAWGIHDMHGNASEWVLDAFDPEWYEQLAQQDVPVTAGNAVDWPTKLFPRVLRGGSWYLDPVDCRSAARRPSDDDQLRTLDPNVPKSPWWFASDDSQDIGMRIIRPLNPPADEERGRYWDADVEKIRRAVKACIVQDGRGRWGLVDPELPQAIEALDE